MCGALLWLLDERCEGEQAECAFCVRRFKDTWVEEIMVREEFRRNGIGELLMEDFERWAASKNCRLVALATRRAAEFYESLGYAESATYFRKIVS